MRISFKFISSKFLSIFLAIHLLLILHLANHLLLRYLIFFHPLQFLATILVLRSWVWFCIKNTLREKCPYSELFWFAFYRIWTEYGEILRISLYSVQMRENAEQNKFEYTFYAVISTFFVTCIFINFVLILLFSQFYFQFFSDRVEWI